jgi:hypothetical protein
MRTPPWLEDCFWGMSSWDEIIASFDFTDCCFLSPFRGVATFLGHLGNQSKLPAILISLSPTLSQRERGLEDLF